MKFDIRLQARLAGLNVAPVGAICEELFGGIDFAFDPKKFAEEAWKSAAEAAREIDGAHDFKTLTAAFASTRAPVRRPQWTKTSDVTEFESAFPGLLADLTDRVGKVLNSQRADEVSAVGRKVGEGPQSGVQEAAVWADFGGSEVKFDTATAHDDGIIEIEITYTVALAAGEWRHAYP
jgi:hypothetical protein